MSVDWSVLCRILNGTGSITGLLYRTGEVQRANSLSVGGKFETVDLHKKGKKRINAVEGTIRKSNVAKWHDPLCTNGSVLTEKG
jgi:hypothetical protein